MLSLKPLLCLLRPLKSFSLSNSPRPFPSFSSSSVSMATTTTEHVVLFNVRPSTDPSKIESMITNLRNLTSLNLSYHLSAGPILRLPSEGFSFTHLLHSRHPSKSDLSAYSSHPDHLSVAKSYVFPICDDIMAVDWVNASGQLPSPSPGSAMRLTLAKPREGTTAAELVAAIEGAMGSEIARRADQVSFGENFSPGMAKGYEVGFISVFKSVEELDSLMEDKDLVEAHKEKVRPLLDSEIVVDYIVPTANPASL